MLFAKFFSYLTVTFVTEAMSIANALLKNRADASKRNAVSSLLKLHFRSQLINFLNIYFFK